MGTDKYKVKILHYMNPHLLWALVENGREENNICFEQIGIYGLLPLDVVIELDGNVYTKRCEDWVPAVYQAMVDILSGASEVWFSVTFTDRTTSIFDDNIHKYGYLTVKMKDGTTVSLLQKLLDTGLVAEDVQYFHQNLNTKLDYVNTADVVKNIKQSLKKLDYPPKYLENLLMGQLTIYQKTVELEETAPRSLDLQLRENHMQLIKKQISNLNVCKDVDEISAGRANTVKKDSTVNSALARKLNVTKLQRLRSDVTSALTINKEDETKNMCSNKVMENEDQTQKQIPMNNFNNKRGKNAKAKNADEDNKHFAIGPPGLNPTQYHIVERPKPEHRKVKEVVEIKEPEDEEDRDMFENTDSELNLEISDLDLTKLKVTPKNFDNKSNMVRHLNNVDNKTNIGDDSNVNKNTNKCSEENVQNVNADAGRPALSSLQRKMKFLKEKMATMNDSSSTADTDSTVRQGDDSDTESITALVDKLDISQGTIKDVPKEPELIATVVQNNADPFKNLDSSKSVFVEKLISPTLMVHTKKGNCIQPVSNLRDIAFGTDIHISLRNMGIKKPMRPQTVSWPTILRGYSLFLVSPFNSGKTIGYLPAVCRLVSDSKSTAVGLSVARLTCIIVCATAYSVTYVEEMCKMFLHKASIFACYIGMTDIDICSAILNGCDILITTPTMLVRLIKKESFGLDLRNLHTFVIDDCERIVEVYQNELKFCLYKVREMLKNRVNKEVKVQYVVASRVWCDFMSSLAKKAPDSVVCVGAFQECVLYSKVNTSVEFLEKGQKLLSMVKFLKDIDKSNKTVIVCRSDDEVHLVEKTLTMLKFVVFACDSTMTIQDLYSIDLALSEYEEPLIGPVVVCCDGNLTHLNITDAHYLIHFSLPRLFSMFCKRFAVLIDNYSSIYDNQHSDVKIKILVEKSNVEQLPKILNFIKRCSDNVPSVLDQICSTVMLERDLSKAQNLTPLCITLLTLGKCPDIWQCSQRHAIFKDHDEPDAWLPREGIIAFKILHYHSTVLYSARIISCTINNETKKYPQTYSMISIKLGMYYSRESNRNLHGIAEIGDICAVALKHNLFARCRVVKILRYTRNNIPSLMLINLIDEEKYEMAKDTCLYHLPDYLKNIESHVARVVLANLAPQDKDLTYSKLAEDQLKRITEKNEDLFMRGQISLVIGNCIFVETLEACQTLSSLNETVVKSNFRNDLLENYAVSNPNHIRDLQKLGENLDFMRKVEIVQSVEVPKPIKVLPEPSWAHLESDSHNAIYYLYAKSPGLFFVQHTKFQDCINILLNDIKEYVSDNPEPVNEVNEGDIVLAEFPDNSTYERARIDSVLDNDKVKCFFVDLGDWRVVSIDKLLSIPGKIITQLPFQAIECRLVGIEPLGDVWSEFSTNWLVDKFYDSSTNLKYLFAKRLTKEKAEFTGGAKYGIALIDTYADDVCINKLMLDANLAEENDEIELLDMIDVNKEKKAPSDAENNEEFSEDTFENKEVSPSETKKGFIPSLLLSNSKKIEASTSDECVIPTSLCTEVDKKGKNGICEQNNIECNNDNQLALKNAFSRDPSSSDASTVSSKDDIRSNQQAAMNILRSHPIRSIPLVDDDDLDDDRWDSENAVLMLLANKSSRNVSDESSSKKNEPKITPRAISASKPDDNIASKSESKAVTNVDQQTNFPLTSNVSVGLHNINTKTDQSKTVSPIKPPASMKETSDKHSDLNWIVSASDNELLLSDKDRKLKINWSQSTNIVIIKIQVKTEKYELNIQDKEIRFCTKANESYFGLEFELYGVVDINELTHFNKGSYVEIRLEKVMSKNWLQLHKGDVRKVMDETTTVTNDMKTEVDACKANAKPVAETDQNEIDTLRKPKVVWRQNKTKVTVKILLITEQYDLIIKDKHIKFYAKANDEEYGFNFELYGVVDVNKSSHSYKGQYIQINLIKVMSKNWLTLSRGLIKFWIVYDADNIDVSSEDEVESTNGIRNLQRNLKLTVESDSDEDFNDDYDFVYKEVA